MINSRILLACNVLIFVSCSKKSSSCEKTISITYWGEQNRVVFMQKAALRFMKEHPVIKISLQHIPAKGYSQKIKNLIASGDAPDIMQTMNEDFIFMRDRGQICALDDIGSVDKKDFIPQIISTLSKNNKLYGLSYFFNYFCSYYNKDIFESMGLPCPDERFSWDNLYQTGKKITRRGKNGIIEQLGSYGLNYEIFLETHGNTLFDEHHTRINVNNKIVKNALDDYKNYLQSGGSVIDTGGDFAPRENFPGGKIGILLDGTWTLADFIKIKQMNYDMTIYPYSTEKTMKFTVNCFVIPQNTKNQLEALIFLEYLTSEKMQDIMAHLGIGVPTRQSALTQYYLIKLLPKGISLLKQESQYLSPAKTFPKSAEIIACLGDYCSVYLTEKNIDFDKHFCELEKKINTLLQD
ncbi:MAG: hypothetical protein A2096_01565 [Spirochaetes bacterium GWF1_41_5]|nr:MAG: hypothetical protein A2096_01565 [Spirochaetes bacterium GWF1_41_5]HBE02452.1 hypothetical protein [Spirochaetia bacterium]